MKTKYYIFIYFFFVSCSNNSHTNNCSTSNENSTNSIQYEVKTSIFLGEGHRRAYERWQNGAIDTNEYNRIVKAREEQYNRLLRQADLTQYNVYAAGLGEYQDFVLRETSIPERKKLMRILNVATYEDRVSYAAGKIGEIQGVVITVSQKIDDKGVLIEDESGRLLRLFIPGLFKKSVEESFNIVSNE